MNGGALLIASPVNFGGKGLVNIVGSNVSVSGSIDASGATNADGVYISDSQDVVINASINGASRNGISITNGERIQIGSAVRSNTPARSCMIARHCSAVCASGKKSGVWQ